MKIEAVSYSHSRTDSLGNKHEIGAQATLDKGEDHGAALDKLKTVVHTEHALSDPVLHEQELNSKYEYKSNLDNQIKAKHDHLDNMKKFADSHGVDQFVPPSNPWADPAGAAKEQTDDAKKLQSVSSN